MVLAMEPKAVTVRYRYADKDDEACRSASYRGRFYECTEAAVRRRLREVHRFASRVEIVEVRWHDPREAARAGAIAADGRKPAAAEARSLPRGDPG